MTTRRQLLLSTLLCPALPAFAGAFAPPGAAPYPSQPGTTGLALRYGPPPGPDARARLAYWTDLALSTIAIDHTPPPAGPSPYAEQRGRTRTSRVMAIFHIAIHDALNAIVQRYPGYSASLPALADSSFDAAIAQAGHDALVELYQRQRSRLDALLQQDLARLPDDRAKLNGIDIGRRAARAILGLRTNDGSEIPDPVVGHNYPESTAPGIWRPDPISGNRVALGAYWKLVKPFVLPSVHAFRAPPPPALGSAAYASAFNEVKRLGGNGTGTPTQRTAEQTVIGTYWGYDDAAWLGTPLRMYNQMVLQIHLSRISDPLELARALALVNAAQADATITLWESKYYYLFWRPVHGVREASPGSGPTGAGDGNPATAGDPAWTPLGAQASNLVGPDFTPAFPSYPSGHAGVGSALFQTLRRMYGDKVPFTFVSDEYNGITRDNDGTVRPYLPRSYASLSQAEEEAGQSRIYLGVHWQFDKTAGISCGRRVADYIYQRGLVRPA